MTNITIPTFLDYPWTDKSGSLLPSAKLYHDELNRFMQSTLSANGWTMPRQPFATIQTLADMMPVGTFWWDTTNSRVVVKQADSPTVLYSVDMTVIP